MNFKTKIKEVITKLKSSSINYKNLNFNELEESELLILEEIYYFNELKKDKLNIEKIKSNKNIELELINERCYV